MPYHLPVLLNECITALNLRPGCCIADVTFGGGGHSREILRQLQGGRLIAFDQDADAIRNIPDDSRFELVTENFRYLKKFLRFYDALPVDGILADLGISSYQIDEPSKGFSTRHEAGADMRMDTRRGLTAAEILNQYDEHRLARVFREYGEIQQAGRLAGHIVKMRVDEPILTTGHIKNVLQGFAPRGGENKFFAQVFQSIRIEVNDELGALQDLLIQSAEVLKPGGRLVVLSYHSLEDRLVKNFMRAGNFSGETPKDFYGNPIAPLRPLGRKPLEASADEISHNPRARSAKLRIAERI
jgi:16S rRNA (cytosine1402-N4)-methyltransferase